LPTADVYRLEHRSEVDMTGRGNPLFRSRTDRMIAGVCGGLARWLGWSPTVVRVLYVALSVLSAAFPGILIYLLLWIVMPQEGLSRGSEPVGSSFR
jgi:phage shock protein PspC (stress-responsive transcriptional regulator)